MTPAAFTPLAIQPQTQPPKQPRSATHLGNASSSASSRLPSNALRSRCASPPTFFLCGVPPAPSSFSGPAPTASSATVPGLPSPRPLLRPLGTAARFGLLAVRRRIRRHQARPRPQAPLAQPVCGFQQRLSHHPRPSPRPHSCCWRLRRASHRLLRPLRRLRHHARSQSAPTMPRQAVHPHLAHEPFAASAVGCARWGHRRIHNLFSVNGHRRIDVAHRRPAARLGPARPVPSLSLHLHHRRRPRLSAHPFTILCMPTHSLASRPLVSAISAALDARNSRARPREHDPHDDYATRVRRRRSFPSPTPPLLPIYSAPFSPFPSRRPLPRRPQVFPRAGRCHQGQARALNSRRPPSIANVVRPVPPTRLRARTDFAPHVGAA